MKKFKIKLALGILIAGLVSGEARAYDYSWNSIDNQMRQGQFAVQQMEAARRAQEMQMMQQNHQNYINQQQQYINQLNNNANRQHQNFNPYLDNFGR